MFNNYLITDLSLLRRQLQLFAIRVTSSSSVTLLHFVNTISPSPTHAVRAGGKCVNGQYLLRFFRISRGRTIAETPCIGAIRTRLRKFDMSQTESTA